MSVTNGWEEYYSPSPCGLNHPISLIWQSDLAYFCRGSDEPLFLLLDVVPCLPLQDGRVRIESVRRPLILPRDVLSLMSIEVPGFKDKFFPGVSKYNLNMKW